MTLERVVHRQGIEEIQRSMAIQKVLEQNMSIVYLTQTWAYKTLVPGRYQAVTYRLRSNIVQDLQRELSLGLLIGSNSIYYGMSSLNREQLLQGYVAESDGPTSTPALKMLRFDHLLGPQHVLELENDEVARQVVKKLSVCIPVAPSIAQASVHEAIQEIEKDEQLPTDLKALGQHLSSRMLSRAQIKGAVGWHHPDPTIDNMIICKEGLFGKPQDLVLLFDPVLTFRESYSQQGIEDVFKGLAIFVVSLFECSPNQASSFMEKLQHYFPEIYVSKLFWFFLALTTHKRSLHHSKKSEKKSKDLFDFCNACKIKALAL